MPPGSSRMGRRWRQESARQRHSQRDIADCQGTIERPANIEGRDDAFAGVRHERKLAHVEEVLATQVGVPCRILRVYARRVDLNFYARVRWVVCYDDASASRVEAPADAPDDEVLYREQDERMRRIERVGAGGGNRDAAERAGEVCCVHADTGAFQRLTILLPPQQGVHRALLVVDVIGGVRRPRPRSGSSTSRPPRISSVRRRE